MFPRTLLRLFALSFLLSAGTFHLLAACDTCASFAAGTYFGTTAIPNLTEASGIAASARNPGVLWTHNDGANGRVFAVSTNGARLASFEVNNVYDVEDIAIGPGPVADISYLYIGDIGGNIGTNETRPNVTILRIPEPLVELAWATNPRSPGFSGKDTFTLVYPDGSFDAEAMMVDPISGDVLVVTKQIGLARFYRANLNGAPDGASIPLEFVQSVSFHQASAGDITADGTQIILRRENTAQLWVRCDEEPLSEALSRSPQVVPVIGTPVEPNGEGVAFLRDRTGYVTISEGTNPAIYFFRSVCPTEPRFSLAPSNHSVFAGSVVEFHSVAAGFPDPTYEWRFDGELLVNQTNADLILSNVTTSMEGFYEVTAVNFYGAVSKIASLIVRLKPNLRITEVMSSAALGPVLTADWWELTSFESQPVNLNGWRFNDNSGELTDPFVINFPLMINPDESIVFVEGLTAAQFGNWWGTNNFPPNLQIITYNGNGLSLGAGGDGLRLWDNGSVDSGDTISSVDFGNATTGVSFNYNPATQQFGALSQLGVNAVIRAAIASDIGSPGRIMSPPASPVLAVSTSGDSVRIEFDAVAGHRYVLESREDFSSGAWSPTGDTLQVVSTTRAFFEKERTGSARFFRMTVN